MGSKPQGNPSESKHSAGGIPLGCIFVQVARSGGDATVVGASLESAPIYNDVLKCFRSTVEASLMLRMRAWTKTLSKRLGKTSTMEVGKTSTMEATLARTQDIEMQVKDWVARFADGVELLGIEQDVMEIAVAGKQLSVSLPAAFVSGSRKGKGVDDGNQFFVTAAANEGQMEDMLQVCPVSFFHIVSVQDAYVRVAVSM